MAAGLDCVPAAPAGHVYMVAGHSVQFPHKAYGTQLSFMNQARVCSPPANQEPGPRCTRAQRHMVNSSIASC